MKHLLTGLLMLASTAASAATFGTAEGYETGRKYITIDGPIEAGDAGRLLFHIIMNPEATWVSMSSPGGLANEGYELGNVISENGLNTYVPLGSACLSACYTAFLGGYEYDIDGVVAAHNAWLDVADASASINDYVKTGQQLGAYDMLWHLANGFSAGLAYTISLNTSPDVFIGFTHEDDLMESFSRTEGDNVNNYLDGSLYTQKWVQDHLVTVDNFEAKLVETMDAEYPDILDPRN